MIEPNPIYKYVACCICQSKTTRAHRLPALSTNEDKLLRYAKWVNFAGIENVYNKQKYYWICEVHFEDNAFCNHLKLKILRTAVPTLHPPIYEGPSKEDGTPPCPTEPKDETLLKIFQEIVDKQLKNEPSGQRKKFYNFLSSTSLAISNETLSRINTEGNQQSRVNSNMASDHKTSHSITMPIVKAVSLKTLNGNFKTPEKTNDSPEKPDCIGKGISGLASSSSNQRTRPLILKKLPTSPKMRPSIIRTSSVNVSDLLKTLSKIDSSVDFLPGLDACPTNPEPASSGMKTIKNISASNDKKPETVDDLPGGLNFGLDNGVSSSVNKQFNQSPINENIHKITDSLSSVVNLTSNVIDEESDILFTEINNCDVSPSGISFMDEEVASNSKLDQSLKYVKKQPKGCKKKYYDPVLIDSVLNKMKLKKNGPVCVVTLEKKPDKLFKGFSKSKLITLYKQQAKKNRKSKKVNQGANDATKKVRKKRRCTCSIHCYRRFNTSSRCSLPVMNVNSSVGVKFEGNAVNQNITDLDPDLADEELFNVENVFNVSTILTNVHDRSQVEQLCQMLIESVFRLKSLNIEGTMAKLEVYIAQVNSSSKVNNTCKTNNSNQNIEMNHDEEHDNSQRVVLNTCRENDCDQSSFISLANEKEMPLYEPPDSAYRRVNNVPNSQPKPKNVKVRLSTFHDHSYIKQESNYIFEKPEYLVKLINIETYRCPRKTVKHSMPAISKKETERHKNVCLKLNNRIVHLRELIKKKNKNIKSMHRKIKYLGGIVCKEKGIKRVKYPKTYEEIQADSSKTEEQSHTNRKDEGKMLLDINIDQLRMDNVVTINSFESSNFFEDNTQAKGKKSQGNKTKKNMSTESLDVLYENLIEELCCNEMQY